MKKTLFYNKYSVLILFAYTLVLICVNIEPMTWKESLVRSLLVLGVMFIHLNLAANRCVKLWAGSLAEPFYVIDWGTFGRSIEDLLPEKLKGRYVAVPASSVEGTRDRILRLIEESNNFVYSDPESDASIEIIFFRIGDRVLEEEDEYLEHIVQEMTKRFTKYHGKLWSDKSGDVDKDGYLNEFVRSHKNGSLVN